MTNYLAIVGPETAWPESHSVSIRDILDGTAYTIRLVESFDSGINWLEPHDLSIADAREGINGDTHPNISSAHRFGVNTLFADGSVRFVKAEVELGIFQSLLTIAGGRPLAGVDWPPDASDGIGAFLPERPPGELARTAILPHTKGRITPGENYVYSATFQLAWDDLKEKLYGPVDFERMPDIADRLNDGTFRRTDVSSDSYVAMGGLVQEGIVAQIEQAMTQKFPTATLEPPKPPESSLDDYILLYAYLQKSLPFAAPFDRLREPLVFHALNGDSRVASFGVKEFKDSPERPIERQVTVLDYENDDDFVLRLATKKNDEIILAKVKPASTLDETLTAVLERIRGRSRSYRRRGIELKESLRVPILAISVDRDYTELVHRPIRNAEWESRFIARASQRIRFILNERGARLESDAFIGIDVGFHWEPPKPRHFVFDKPFLLCIREGPDKEPYLVMWIENSEVMELWKK
jgi:prepilin-type processing-associated H-X9-DG protein